MMDEDGEGKATDTPATNGDKDLEKQLEGDAVMDEEGEAQAKEASATDGDKNLERDATMDAEAEAQATETSAIDGDKSLEKQLEALEKQNEDAQKAQIDANIADLKKLIEDAHKADEDYAKIHEQLRDDEARLKGERDTLSAALEAALGEDGIKAVKDIVITKVNDVTAAETALNTAKTALDTAQGEADEAAAELRKTKASLDDWRKPGDSIGKRLKSAQALIDEIKKLRNGSRRGEAYWKLALGELATVPGQNFLNIELSREPQVIPPEDLRAQIEKVWGEFTDARTVSAEKALDLQKAKTAHKEAEGAFKDATKNLIKAITDALAEREVEADAA